MQLLYDERRHEAVLAEYEQAPREFFNDGGPREETQFVGALAANARMKLDFSAGMEDSRRIRIRCNGQEIAIFIGEAMKPTWSSSVYASAMKRANPIGYARFRGENVRLSDIIVRPVGE